MGDPVDSSSESEVVFLFGDNDGTVHGTVGPSLGHGRATDTNDGHGPTDGRANGRPTDEGTVENEE